MRTLKKAYDRLRFQTKVMMLTTILIFVIFIALSIYIRTVIAENIKEEVSEKALAVSNTISENTEIIDAMDNEEPEKIIQPLTKSIQEQIGAEFIVIGNANEIRYSHTLADRIGKTMVGDDNERALNNGETYVSEQVGSLGLSIRGKSPIIKDGNVIGVVSVGYLIDNINEKIAQKNRAIITLFIVFLIIGVTGSLFIARHLKKLLFHMEPHEIAEEHLQKEAILKSTKEGIIAVNSNNHITLLNDSAKEMLQLERYQYNDIIGKPLQSIIELPLLHDEQMPFLQDGEFIMNNEIVLMNTFALQDNQKRFGAVATFRKKTDLEKFTKELSTIKQYTEGLRAQTHEYANKIHTILGLLQLDHKDAAIDFIRSDTEIRDTRRHVMTDAIEDPVIEGLFIAKMNIANEKGVQFNINKDSHLGNLISFRYRDVLLKVLGNIIDNAFYAVNNNPQVEVFITDIGKDIVMEIDDNGPGIQPADEAHIFDHGFSTKHKNGHGNGLYLVKKAVSLVGGEIFLEAGVWNGARFVVIIPKEGEVDATATSDDH